MTALASILAALAALAWGTAVVAALLMLRYRRPEMSVARLIFSGVSWFRAGNFTPEAVPYRRVFVGAFAAFMILVVSIAVWGLFIAR